MIGQSAAQRGDGDVEAFVRPESAGRQERLPVHDEAGPDRGDDLATRQLGGRRPRPRTDGHQDGRIVLHHHLGAEVANPEVVGRPGPQPALGVDDLRHGGHDVAVERGRQPIEPARLQRHAAGVDEAHEVASDAGDDPVDGRTKPLVADRTGHDDLVGSNERRKVHSRRRRLDHDDGLPSIGANRCEGLDGAVEVGPPPLPARSTDPEPGAQQREPRPALADHRGASEASQPLHPAVHRQGQAGDRTLVKGGELGELAARHPPECRRVHLEGRPSGALGQRAAPGATWRGERWRRGPIEWLRWLAERAVRHAVVLMGTSTSSFEHAVIYGDDEPPPSLARYARELWSRRSLLNYLTRTRLKAQHYDTTFGKAWLVLGPLMMAGVYMLARGVMRPSGDEEHARMVIAHIVMGVFIFQYVAGGITTGASSVLANTRMVLNTSMPCGVFPTSSLMGGVITLMPTLVVLLAVRAVLRQPFGISLLAVPVVVVLLTGFIYGVSLALAALTVYFRDTTNFLTYLTRLWLFLTPVIYTVDEIPPHLRRILALNPLYPYYAALDDALSAQWPAHRYLVWAAAWTVGALVVGLPVFLAKERDFAVRL